MMNAAQEQLLQRFVQGLTFDHYDDYHVRQIKPALDSGPHAQGWQGRFLLLSGSVRLDIGERSFSFGAGESYEVPPDVTHREVFCPEGATFVIARRFSGKPLPPVDPASTLNALRERPETVAP